VGKVTLTFDNGPEASVTPQVLACLERYRAKATFFVIGEKAATPAGGELIKKVAGEGHRVGSHTWSHKASLGNLDAVAAVAEFERGAEAVERWGIKDRLFRPKGGGGRIGPHMLHPAVIPKIEAGGYTCVLWNSVPGDWRDPDGWQPRALEDIRSLDWTLLVLHDIPSGAMNHVDAFLKRVTKEGHTLVQEFPPDCVPILKGRAVLPLADYVTAS
jgi:peptidoglycan/xylan/chitin deacetylase (PgdA/CDA1 family)